ncbi:unnamed protein product, partial [Prorocentrum cordatum]
ACPRSGMILATSINPFLNMMEKDVDQKGRAATRVCAGDAGASLRAIERFAVCANVFEEADACARLQFGFPKRVGAPAVDYSTGALKMRIQGFCDDCLPQWARFNIALMAQYLGALRGPAMVGRGWHGPAAKWQLRGKAAAQAHGALALGIRACDFRCAPALENTAQEVFPGPGVRRRARGALQLFDAPQKEFMRPRSGKRCQLNVTLCNVPACERE